MGILSFVVDPKLNYKFNLGDYPKLKAHYNRICANPKIAAWNKAHPDQ